MPDGDRVCTADHGPRWLVVRSAGRDLTGTAVDDFGCADVRLAGDPFGAAPGDPQEDGTVAGVLTGPADLVTDLSGWWDAAAPGWRRTRPATAAVGRPQARETVRVARSD